MLPETETGTAFLLRHASFSYTTVIRIANEPQPEAMLKNITLKEKILPQPPSFSKKTHYEIHGVLGTGTFGKVMVSVPKLLLIIKAYIPYPTVESNMARTCISVVASDLGYSWYGRKRPISTFRHVDLVLHFISPTIALLHPLCTSSPKRYNPVFSSIYALYSTSRVKAIIPSHFNHELDVSRQSCKGRRKWRVKGGRFEGYPQEESQR